MAERSQATETDRPSISRVLRRPGVAKTFALSLAARLPATGIASLIALKVAEGHDWTTAGIIDAVLAVSLAIAGPFWARQLERSGPTLVLAGQSVVAGLVLGGFALVAADTPAWIFALFAIAGGASEPMHGGAMRGIWDQLLDRDDERHVGYALESAALEALFAFSTAVFVGIVAATWGVDAGLLAAAAVGTAAGVWFAFLPALRGWGRHGPEAAAEGRSALLGALVNPRARTVTAISVAIGLHLGPIELGVPALGQALGSLHGAGVMLAAWGTGSAVAVIGLTRLGPAADPVHRMSIFLVVLAATSALLLLASSVVVAAALLFLVGAGNGPFWATLNASLGRMAPGESVAELYAISLSGILVGAMSGAPIAGVLVDHVSEQAALASGAIGPLIALAILRLKRRDFDPPTGAVASG